MFQLLQAAGDLQLRLVLCCAIQLQSTTLASTSTDCLQELKCNSKLDYWLCQKKSMTGCTFYHNTLHPGGMGVLPYSLSGRVLLGLWKSYSLLDQILQILRPYTRLKMLNCSWFQSFVSDPIKRDPILDQFEFLFLLDPILNQMAWKPYPFQQHIPV